VVAAKVGGLRTAVAHGVSGLLVDGHEPAEWAATLGGLLDDDGRRHRMRSGAVAQARRFSWDATVDGTAEVYAGALADHRHRRLAALASAGAGAGAGAGARTRNALAVAP
jgi:D-inositol-3-phosphate glycosyltransferase